MTGGLRIDMEIREAAALAAAWLAAPRLVLEELRKATLEAELLLERGVKELTPVGVGAGGGLKGSISAREPRVLRDSVIGEVGTPFVYAVPVELGSRPHFPPIQPLADWAQAKLGVSAAEARGVGFAIARKISRVGTEGAFMFKRAFDANRRQVEQIYARARQRILQRLAAGGRS